MDPVIAARGSGDATDLILTSALVVLLIAGVVASSYWSATRRVRSLRSLASELGFRLHESQPDALVAIVDRYLLRRGAESDPDVDRAPLNVGALPGFPLLQIGHAKKVGHWLDGRRNGTAAWVLEYQYTTGSGRSASTHRWLCALTHCMQPSAPVTVTHSGTLGHLLHLVGVHGVETGAADFDAAYRIDCRDAAFAKALLDDGMRTFFLENNVDVRVEVADGALLCAMPFSASIERVTGLLDTLAGIAARVPQPLRAEDPETSPLDDARATSTRTVGKTTVRTSVRTTFRTGGDAGAPEDLRAYVAQLTKRMQTPGDPLFHASPDRITDEIKARFPNATVGNSVHASDDQRGGAE